MKDLSHSCTKLTVLLITKIIFLNVSVEANPPVYASSSIIIDFTAFLSIGKPHYYFQLSWQITDIRKKCFGG